MSVEIAAGCLGISTYQGFKHVIQPVPEEYLEYYVPGPWQERLLPVGAYTSLWPNERGNSWSKVKPDGFGPEWRPTV